MFRQDADFGKAVSIMWCAFWPVLPYLGMVAIIEIIPLGTGHNKLDILKEWTSPPSCHQWAGEHFETGSLTLSPSCFLL